jgi:fibronectin-binding autotransporter adhesin
MKKQVGILAVAAVFGFPAHAQTWIGGSGNAWGTGANWTGGTVPAGAPTTAVTFDGTALSFTPDVNTAVSVNSLSVTSAGYSFSNQAITFIGTGPILSVTQPGTSFANPILFSANTTVHNTHPLTFAGGIGGAASFTKTGAGTLVLTGPTWHNGSAIVTAGTLQIGDTFNTPLSVGAIVNGAALVFDSGPAGIVDIAGSITGSGTLTVTAGSAVRNTSTFPIAHQGLTTLNGSLTLQPGGMNSNGALVLGPSGALTMMTGATVGSLTGPSTASIGVNSATLVTGGDDTSTTYAGILSGNGNLRKVGAGTFTVTSNNFVSGTLEVDAGTMRIGDGTNGPGTLFGAVTVDGTLELDRALGSISIPGPVTGTGDIWIKAGTTISHNGTAPFTHQGLTLIDGTLQGGFPASIDNNGPVVISSTGRLNLSGSATLGSVAGSGRIDNFGTGLTVGGDNTSTTISGLLSGSGDFRKVGSGTLTVSSSSFFDGDTTVEAPGTLQLGNGTQGPSILRALTINGTLLIDSPNVGLNGAVSGVGTLRVQTGSSVTNFAGIPIAHQGPTIVNGMLDAGGGPFPSIDNNAPLVIGPSGTFTTRSGNVGSIAGFGTLNAISGTFVAGGDNTSTTFAGTITGVADFRKTGSGTLTLANTSFFGADVIVEAPGALRLGDGTTGPANVQSFIVDGALLFNTPNITVSGNISGNGTVTVQTGSTVSYNGSFPMTHAGTTIISGQLNSPSVAAVSNGSVLLLSGGLVTRGGNVGSIAGGGTLQLAPGGAFTTGGNNIPTAYAGTLSGPGGLVKTGTGVFTLSGASPAYTGLVQVATGTLNVTGTVGTTGLTVVTGATLMGTGTVAGPVNVEIGGTVAPGASPGTITTGNLSLAGTLQIEVLGTAPGTQHDRIVANGTVLLNGGTLVLSGGYVPVPGNTLTIIQNDGTDPVTGNFAGLGEGGTLAFNGVTLSITYAGGTGNDVVLSVANFTVTPSAGSNGTISPNTPQSVAPGNTLVFTLAPVAGFTPTVGGTCGGNLVGNTYTTNPVNSNCTVVASFSLTSYMVTPSAGSGGSISPSTPQPVAPGGTLTFTLSPNTGFSPSVSGTCGGNLVGNTYTTNAVNANCSVVATFAAVSYTVTPSAGANGTISPNTPQSIPHGSTASFGVNPDPGYVATVGGTCGGTLAGTTYLTNPITASCTVSATFTAPDAARLMNISGRMQVSTGDNVMIGGFIIGGSTPKTVLVRGRGPSLIPHGLPDALPNPEMRLFSGQTQIGFNDNWGDATNAAVVAASGLAPTNPLDAAILVTLAPGPYTAIVSGLGGLTGIGIVEVFEVDTPQSPLANISVRGRVGVGDQVIIVGFIIHGTGPQQVAVRARGPSLTSFGVPGVLANPAMILVRSSDQAVIGVNDNWGDATNAAALTASGFAPSDPNEAALLVTLAPGAYTVVVSGVGSSTGVAIVEVFAAP